MRLPKSPARGRTKAPMRGHGLGRRPAERTSATLDSAEDADDAPVKVHTMTGHSDVAQGPPTAPPGRGRAVAAPWP